MGPEDETMDALGGVDSLEQYATYEDYLDSQISETDMYYLEVCLFFWIYQHQNLLINAVLGRGPG